MKQLTGGAVLALACLTAGAAAASDWEEIEAFYRREGHSEALSLRARAFFRLATVSEGRGLPLLIERYRSPREPHAEEERFLMASALRYAGRDEATQAVVARWLEVARGRDPWLAFNAMLSRADDSLVGIAADGDAPAWRRAAAIQAAGLAAPDLEATIAALAQVATSDALPSREDDLHLLSGALGAALLDLKVRVELDPYGEVDRDACHPLVTALMGLLQHPDLGEASARLLERRLSQFGQQGPADEAEDADPGATRLRGGSASTPAQFMGVTVENARRIVYVLDLSDSMLALLTTTERDELTRRAEAAGPGGGSQTRKPRQRLDWSRIRTRFDAAREFLKLSLAALSEDTAFAVVGFGDEASLLRSTPKLIRAKRRNVARVVAELDAIEPRRYADRDREGLWGNTNLHAALRLAFRVSTRGVLDAEECARPDGPRETLADAIFFLSDGTPTRDDFAGKGPEEDVEEGSWTEVDPETGEVTEHVSDGGRGHQTHDGPYQDLQYVRPDLERLNLFRWTQIHVVGIGECDRYWGLALTELGEGELQIIGSDAGD